MTLEQLQYLPGELQGVDTGQEDENRILRVGPFVGPRAFLGSESALLFGRHNEERQLADLIAAGSLTVVYGESGVGKSSLLSARLPLALRAIDPDWVVIGFSQWQPGFENELALEISRTIGGRRHARLFGHRLLAYAQLKRVPVVLIFDQFEEYFLYHKRSNDAFEAELASIANLRNSPVRLVLSLRDDELFRLARLREHVPDVYRNLFLVEPLDRQGATDAVKLPIRTYNEIAVRRGRADLVVPEPDAAVVNAIVTGSDQFVIRRRLHLGGRGITEEPVGRRQIVAPFLQLALEMLWVRDVVDQRRQNLPSRGLQLSTLMKLGDITETAESAEAVGRLVEGHVNAVLNRLTENQQRICSFMLTSMITPSGSKVAIRVPLDLERQLTPDDYSAAVSLAKSLAAKNRDRLFRHVAPEDEQDDPDTEIGRDPEATGPREDRRYEILHDALAVPLLNWVANWEARQRRLIAEQQHDLELKQADARRKRQMLWLGAGAVLASASVILAFLIYFSVARSVESKRLIQIASGDTAPEFRERILLALSSWKLTSKLMPWDNRPEDMELRIQGILRAAPLRGGKFAAFGIDSSGTKFAWIQQKENDDGTYWGTCAQSDSACDTSIEKSTGRIPPAQIVSKSERLKPAFGNGVSFGFMDGLADPVLYRQGILTYSTGSGNSRQWKDLDLEPYLTPEIKTQSGFLSVELVSGEIQMRLTSLSDRIMRIVHLRWNSGEDGPLVPSIPPAKISWAPDEAVPTVSDRAALSANVAIDPPHPIAGQSERNVATVAKLSSGPDQVSTAAISDRPKAARVGLQAPPSLAFSRGSTSSTRNGALVWHRGSELIFMPVIDNRISGPPTGVSVDKAITGYDKERPLNPQYPLLGPLLAVAERKAGNLDSWRVAWLVPSGAIVVTVAGDLNAKQLTVTDARRLTTGIEDGGIRLEFSDNARFLILRQMVMDRARQSLRIWDLDAEYTSTRGELLTKQACKIAAIEDAGARYTERELLTIFGNRPQPEVCP